MTLVLVPLSVVLLAYLVAVQWQWRDGRSWSRWRVASFASGIGVLALALTPPFATFAHADLRGHMLQHLLVGMFAPLGLVLAAPMTLALRTLSVPAARRVTAVLCRRPVTLLSHPVTALVLNIGGMALLYLTPLYAAMLTYPLVHALVLFHFLVAGCLFTWAIAGPDPAPHRPGLPLRLGVLFVGIAAHATLSKFMYAYLWPNSDAAATTYAGQLLYCGIRHDAAQIRAAAQLMYYGGDIAELLLAVALFAGWYQRRGRSIGTAKRYGQ